MFDTTHEACTLGMREALRPLPVAKSSKINSSCHHSESDHNPTAMSRETDRQTDAGVSHITIHRGYFILMFELSDASDSDSLHRPC